MIPVGFVLLACMPEAEKAIIESVRSIPKVTYAYKVSGVYSIVIKVESESVEEFTLAIESIRKVPNILNTDTMIGFKKA